MQYTLITNSGKIYTFFLEAVAKTYLQAYGGVLVDNTVFQQESADLITV